METLKLNMRSVLPNLERNQRAFMALLKIRPREARHGEVVRLFRKK